jgi:hypothetical protein
LGIEGRASYRNGKSLGFPLHYFNDLSGIARRIITLRPNEFCQEFDDLFLERVDGLQESFL